MENVNRTARSRTSDENSQHGESPKAEKPRDGAVDFVFCSRCGHTIVVTGPHVICGFCGARCCATCGE